MDSASPTSGGSVRQATAACKQTTLNTFFGGNFGSEFDSATAATGARYPLATGYGHP